MRKLFLTSFTFTTGENEYREYRITAINSNGNEESDLKSVYDLTQFWFKSNFPESKLLSLQAHATITEAFIEQTTVQSENIIDAGKRFYPICDIEGLEEVIGEDGESDGYTKDVLIDIDGNKKNFRIGWQDIDDDSKKRTWYLYDKDSKIDMKHAVYTKLDF